MPKRIGRTFTVSLLLLAPVAFAEPGASEATPSPEAPASAVPTGSASTAVAPAAPSALPAEQNAEASAQADVASKLEALEAKVGGLSEAQAAADSTVNGLEKVKLSGYVQGRKDSAIYWNDQPGNPATDVKKLGFILTAVQNIGDNLGVVVRVDQIDPNTSKDKAMTRW